MQRTFKTPGQGRSHIRLGCTSPKLGILGGVYCEDVEIAELRDQESPG